MNFVHDVSVKVFIGWTLRDDSILTHEHELVHLPTWKQYCAMRLKFCCIVFSNHSVHKLLRKSLQSRRYNKRKPTCQITQLRPEGCGEKLFIDFRKKLWRNRWGVFPCFTALKKRLCHEICRNLTKIQSVGTASKLRKNMKIYSQNIRTRCKRIM